jgi:hypothetical protein
MTPANLTFLSIVNAVKHTSARNSRSSTFQYMKALNGHESHVRTVKH